MRSFNLGRLELARGCRAGNGARLYLKHFQGCTRVLTKKVAEVTRISFILALCFVNSQRPELGMYRRPPPHQRLNSMYRGNCDHRQTT